MAMSAMPMRLKAIGWQAGNDPDLTPVIDVLMRNQMLATRHMLRTYNDQVSAPILFFAWQFDGLGSG